MSIETNLAQQAGGHLLQFSRAISKEITGTDVSKAQQLAKLAQTPIAKGFKWTEDAFKQIKVGTPAIFKHNDEFFAVSVNEAAMKNRKMPSEMNGLDKFFFKARLWLDEQFHGFKPFMQKLFGTFTKVEKVDGKLIGETPFLKVSHDQTSLDQIIATNIKQNIPLENVNPNIAQQNIGPLPLRTADLHDEVKAALKATETKAKAGAPKPKADTSKTEGDAIDATIKTVDEAKEKLSDALEGITSEAKGAELPKGGKRIVTEQTLTAEETAQLAKELGTTPDQLSRASSSTVKPDVVTDPTTETPKMKFVGWKTPPEEWIATKIADKEATLKTPSATEVVTGPTNGDTAKVVEQPAAEVTQKPDTAKLTPIAKNPSDVVTVETLNLPIEKTQEQEAAFLAKGEEIATSLNTRLDEITKQVKGQTEGITPPVEATPSPTVTPEPEQKGFWGKLFGG